MSTCRTCGAPMVWARTAKGKRIPLDPEPTPGGNVVYVDDETVAVLGRGAAAQYQGSRYVSHWVTCASPPPRRR